MPTFTPRLIVEPDDGLEPVQEFIESAETSLLIKQFNFTAESLIQAVIDRKNTGVDVRVMLNPKRSGGDRVNDETYERFKRAGINVQWSNPKFYVTHEKSIVADEKSALVATFNLSPKYFTHTRDYGIVTQDPQHVAQIVEVFNIDWEHGDWTPSTYEGLLWSNANSRLHMAHFIDTAQQRLDVQHPKYVDAVILDHIAAAADRGVKVQVLCGGRHGISDWDILDTFASLRTLRRFRVKVHKQKNLRVPWWAALMGRSSRTRGIGHFFIELIDMRGQRRGRLTGPERSSAPPTRYPTTPPSPRQDQSTRRCALN